MMTETQFGGSSPVARYWLARCEGFAVQGGERGVVEELLHDADPFVTTRLVVRTRGRRRKLVAAAAIASVDPAERVLVVQRRRTLRPTHHARATTAAALAELRVVSSAARRSVPPAARRVRRVTDPVSALARSAAAAAGAGTLTAWSAARAKAPGAARYARHMLAPAGRALVRSFGLLLAEALATVGMPRKAAASAVLSRRDGRARSAG